MISDNLKKRIYTSLALLGLVILMFNSNIMLIYFLIIMSVLSILEFSQLTKKISDSLIIFSIINLFFIIYIFVFSFMFFLFSNFAGLKIILFILLLGCIASDIGGFTFGKIFKGPKITKISPNKTYTGAAGSLIFTSIIVSLLFYYTQTFEKGVCINKCLCDVCDFILQIIGSARVLMYPSLF